MEGWSPFKWPIFRPRAGIEKNRKGGTGHQAALLPSFAKPPEGTKKEKKKERRAYHGAHAAAFKDYSTALMITGGGKKLKKKKGKGI